jgi:hypothetical protein
MLRKGWELNVVLSSAKKTAFFFVWLSVSQNLTIGTPNGIDNKKNVDLTC